MTPRSLLSRLLVPLALAACSGGAPPAQRPPAAPLPAPWAALAARPSPAPAPRPPLALPSAEPPTGARVAPPPPAVVQAFGLSPLYVRYLDAGGMPILGSAKVHDEALLEAAHVVRAMLARRPELLGHLGQQRVRLVVMATTEMTTDVPEHADLTPRADWDRRARGLGPTHARPAVSCAEENLLEIAGDPYPTENILVHEFGHAVMEMAMPSSDPSFVPRVRAAYEGARSSGLWRGTYAMENASEYWAELTQSWFDTNRSNDAFHNDVDTREEVKRYDPAGARLLIEVYGDLPWRYQWPSRRPAREREHLAGLDRSRVTPFAFRDPAPAPRTPPAPTGVPSSPRVAPSGVRAGADSARSVGRDVGDDREPTRDDDRDRLGRHKRPQTQVR